MESKNFGCFFLLLIVLASRKFNSPHPLIAICYIPDVRVCSVFLFTQAHLMARLVQDLNHSRNVIFHSETIPAFGSSFKSGINDSRNKPFPQSSPI
ncbi:hypothetical protein LguiB_016952 [Lonicera macranthoides]